MSEQPRLNNGRAWPMNRNHEAARRRVNQILRDHGRPEWKRETQIAAFLEDLIRERDKLREKVYGPHV
jgi:hypothetical protein